VTTCSTSGNGPGLHAKQAKFFQKRLHFAKYFRTNPLAGQANAKLLYVYSQKFNVTVVIAGTPRLCPIEWLDQFCMRNFTNSADFDDTLPVAEGRIEASFRVKPQRFAEGLSAWLTQRGKGEGQPVKVEVTLGEH
jgi:hypothetical protein